ncbi:MAG TPA: sulfatase [Phycisphaerae bacterium]|nr:sulfatase [Phycisphaerae bacterium]
MPPNILFFIIDDLNDSVGYLGTRPGIQTPNMDALAARGVRFMNAHVNAPLCNASRASFLTGLRPSTTGVYSNADPWRYTLRDRKTMPEYFSAHGYRSLGMGGKLFHYADAASWNEAFECDIGPQPATLPAHGIAGLGYIDWSPLNIGDSQMGNAVAAAHAAQYVSESHSQPFFLAVGFGKPHYPSYLPQSYFDQYPSEDIVLPTINEQDLDDVPPTPGLNGQRGIFNTLRTNNAWDDAVRAYYAGVSFTDTQIGVILDALDNGPHAANTIVVLVSDNGYHLGEKLLWGKYTLWEESCRVPLIIAGPGVSAVNQPCNRAVSLLDLYPTLLELTGLPPYAGLEGASLVPLLADPEAAFDHPAITTLGTTGQTVRTDRWRLIRYANGGTELYDHDVDPHEWTNLAEDPGHAQIRAELLALLPEVAPTTKAPPRTLLVKADATGNGDGTSWGDAMTDVRMALDIANASTWYPPQPVVKEIWVAEGTYTPDIAGGDREKTFRIFRGASLYGGFGGWETSRDQRQPMVHRTILSGDLNGDDGPGQTNRSDNSYHIISAVNAVRDSVIDGFHISGGNADTPPYHARGGGAVMDHASPIFLNCTFADNHAEYGGAFFNNGGNNSVTIPLVINCVFAGNTADIKGGAIYSQSDYLNPINCYFGTFGFTNPNLFNCTIVGNSAPVGGGLSADPFCNSFLYNCILWGNTDANGNSHFAQLVGGYMYTRYTCIQNYVTTPYTGPNNIAGNPHFVDELGPDGLAFNGDEDLRLQSGSACIDAGNNADVPADTMDCDQDLNTSEPIAIDGHGANRFEDDPLTLNVNNAPPPVVDMGAFEYFNPQACPLSGDANRDGAVDGLDIQVLVDCTLNGFSPLADCTCADINQDQITSLVDIDIYIEMILPDPSDP